MLSALAGLVPLVRLRICANTPPGTWGLPNTSGAQCYCAATASLSAHCPPVKLALSRLLLHIQRAIGAGLLTAARAATGYSTGPNDNTLELHFQAFEEELDKAEGLSAAMLKASEDVLSALTEQQAVFVALAAVSLSLCDGNMAQHSKHCSLCSPAPQ